MTPKPPIKQTFIDADSVFLVGVEVEIFRRLKVIPIQRLFFCLLGVALQNFLNVMSPRVERVRDVLDLDINGLVIVLPASDVEVNLVVDDVVVYCAGRDIMQPVAIGLFSVRPVNSLHVARCPNTHFHDPIRVEQIIKNVIIVVGSGNCPQH